MARSSLRLDVGCGRNKREGFVGVDIIEGVDVVCDVSTDDLPFAEGSVDELFTSHCLEHIDRQNLYHVFREFTRVARDGTRLEIWHPYGFHGDAHIFGHRNVLTEQVYYHLCVTHQEFWTESLRGRWQLDEVRYNVDAATVVDLAQRRVDLDYAINYLHDVVREIGFVIHIQKGSPTREAASFQRVVCVGNRDRIDRVLSTGPYVGLKGRLPTPVRRALRFPARVVKRMLRPG